MKQLSSLNRILQNEEEIVEAYKSHQSSNKRTRFTQSEVNIDEDLYNYFISMRAKKAEINTEDLKFKALELATNKGLKDFKASNGFIREFKSRHNIQFKHLHGTSDSCDLKVVNEWFAKVNDLIKAYEDNNVYNLDETGLFYEAERGKSFVTGIEGDNRDLRGIKQSKKRVTVLVGASLSEEKLPLLVLGKSQTSGCFRGVKTLLTLYRNQISSLMDSNIFVEYLTRLDKQFHREQRKCIIFVDNCRSHPPANQLKHLKNSEIIFFPPNVTALCQPMDMGIIHALKTRYKNALCREKNIHLENNTPFRINLLDAM